MRGGWVGSVFFYRFFYEIAREVHVSDGIDMGNMQYPTEGLVGQDLF